MPHDLSAYHAGMRHAASLAQIVALTLESRPDAADMRQRAAIEALRGLADGLRGEASTGQVEGVLAPSTAAGRED